LIVIFNKKKIFNIIGWEARTKYPRDMDDYFDLLEEEKEKEEEERRKSKVWINLIFLKYVYN